MTLTIFEPQVTVSPAGTKVLFSGETPEGPFQVKVAHSLTCDQPLPPTALGDAALALFLLPALKLGLPLQIQAPVSPALLDTLPTLQEIYCTWYPETFKNPVRVTSTACSASPESPAASGRGCFFSGGVDSFHAVLKNKDSLNLLIFAHGFDVPLANRELRSEVSTHLQAAAASLGIPLVEVETDVRQFSDLHVHWGSHFCGAAMAALAHLLSPWLGHVVVPASMSYRDLQPFGTHIYTDERWSSERVRLIHDGMECRRVDKIRSITQHPAAMNHLRVCWRNHGNQYNCGHCEKCLRTMANLRALGRLQECRTFPQKLDLQTLSEIDVDHPVIIPFLQETLEEANAAGDEALARAIRQCLVNCQATMLARELTPLRNALPEDKIWQEKTVPRFRDTILATCWTVDPEWTSHELVRHAAKNPDALLDMLWKHHRGWLIRQYVVSRLQKLNPFRRRSPVQHEHAE